MDTGTILILAFFAAAGGWFSGYTYFCNLDPQDTSDRRKELRRFGIPGAIALLVGASLFLLNKLIGNPDTWRAIGLAIIILLSGALGGLIGFYNRTLPDGTSEEDKQKLMIISILKGVGGALLVPLLLHILTSNLLAEFIDGKMEKAFILAGFCMAAGISSDAFIPAIIKSFNKYAQGNQDPQPPPENPKK